MGKKLFKARTDVKLDGVCSGLSTYAGIDVTVVRLVWAVGTVFTGFVGGILLYIVCGVLMPREPEDGYIDVHTQQ